jgi:hypothetical protein
MVRRQGFVVSLVLVALCAFASPARADKDPQTARILSGAAAGVSGGVVLAGFLVVDRASFNPPVLYTGIGMLMLTPSLGEWYAGQYLTIGMGVRAAAAALAIYTLQTQTIEVTCITAMTSNEPKCKVLDAGVAYPLLSVATIAFIGGVWYDVLDAKDAAVRYNQRKAVRVMPTALQGPQGLAPGLAFGGTF